MNIGGVVPFSLSDYPGCVAAVVFTKGCNFNCPYCHNRGLIAPCEPAQHPRRESAARGDEEVSALLMSLREQRRFLDGLVVSGGEPTCQLALKPFITAVKDLGLKVKLDTNGSHPEVLVELLENELLDYVAMDIKAPWRRYPEVVNRAVDVQAIRASVDVLWRSPVAHEFRITAASPLLSADDLLEIGGDIGHKGPLYLQKFRQPHFKLAQRMDTTAGIDLVCSKLQRAFNTVYIR